MSRKTFAPNEHVRDADNSLVYGMIAATTLRPTKVSLGGTATALPSSALDKRKFVEIFNNSTDVIYIGDATVTTLTGRPVYPHGSVSYYVEEEVTVYGISAGTTSDVRIIEGA